MRRTEMRWAVAMVVVAGLLITGGAEARGDVCSECGPPTLEDLQKDPAFKLEKRGLGALDEVHLHGGECRIELVGAPVIAKKQSWLVLRGQGAVWNCPSSTASDTMTATVTQSDRKEWSFSVSSSASAAVLGVGLSAEVIATVSEASEVQEVTSISKQMSAKFCRVIAWKGYFEVADYEADVTFKVERRFAWWTKNVFSGDTVHRSGEIWLACGAHEATLDMRAPIAGYFRLHQTPCPDPECKTIPAVELGWFPPLPKGLQPPITPGEGDEEATPEEDEPAAPKDDPQPDPSEDEDPPSSDELGDPPTAPVPAPAPQTPSAPESAS